MDVDKFISHFPPDKQRLARATFERAEREGIVTTGGLMSYKTVGKPDEK